MQHTFRVADIGEQGRHLYLVDTRPSELMGGEDAIDHRRRRIAAALGVSVGGVVLFSRDAGVVVGTNPYPDLIVRSGKWLGADWQSLRLDLDQPDRK